MYADSPGEDIKITPVKLPAFKYAAPQSLADAIDLLAANDNALPLAGDWWQSFDDSALSRLIGQALAAHPTLAQAQARAAQARAMADMVHSATSPTWLSMIASGTPARIASSLAMMLLR